MSQICNRIRFNKCLFYNYFTVIFIDGETSEPLLVRLM